MDEFDSVNEVLIACVKACGGSKQVGARLWPEKTVEAAQRHLLACLNDDKPERLSPDQFVLLLRMARERGCHVGMQYLCDSLGYAEPLPIDPRDEAAELQRQYIEAARQMGKLAERIERLSAPVTVREIFAGRAA